MKRYIVAVMLFIGIGIFVFGLYSIAATINKDFPRLYEFLFWSILVLIIWHKSLKYSDEILEQIKKKKDESQS